MLKPKLLTVTAVVLSLSLGTVASIAAAQESGKQTGKPHTGMMGMMKGVDPAQMRRMVENCNRMMESMMQNMPATPGPEKKG
jgi:hypothetical protein